MILVTAGCDRKCAPVTRSLRERVAGFQTSGGLATFGDCRPKWV